VFWESYVIIILTAHTQHILQGWGEGEVLKYSISFKGRREKSFSSEIPIFIFGQ
jgi:hypothetical protein